MSDQAVRRPRGGECQCCACGVFFTSLSAFDAHQRIPGTKGRKLGDTPVLCLSAENAGLVAYQRANGTTWGFPGDPDAQSRFGAA